MIQFDKKYHKSECGDERTKRKQLVLCWKISTELIYIGAGTLSMTGEC